VQIVWNKPNKLESANACYYSEQYLLSPRLLSKNIKIKVHRAIILSFALYGCETWSFTLREEHRVRVFDNRVLKRVFGPWRDETREWRRLQNEELIICTPYKILFGWSNQEE